MPKPKEIWKPVPRFKRYYAISNYGRLKRTKSGPSTFPGKIIKPVIKKDGYLRYYLRKNTHKNEFLAHRLVMLVFNGKPPNEKEVNHKNGNRADNCFSNLEYVTRKENIQHAIHVLKRPIGKGNTKGEINGMAKLTANDVKKIRKLHKTIPDVQIANQFGISKKYVWEIAARKKWKHIH